jgi:uncharacterized membrane protein
MKKLNIINEIKGVAFLLMIVHHIFYFYDVSNDYKTKYSKNIIVQICGLISRHLFILLVGINIFLQYSNNKDIYKNIFNSGTLKLLFSCLIISFATYIIHPKYWIRFGVLHFILFGSIFGKLFAVIPNSCIFLSIIFFLCFEYVSSKNINNIVDLFTGAASGKYYMMDYFPFFRWFPFVLLGIWTGKNIILNLDDIKSKTFLSYLGKNSLLLYVIHVIILLLIYN